MGVLTAIQRCALEQVKKAGRKGLMIQYGRESTTQAQLVELGLIYQEHGSPGYWKFTVTPHGDRALSVANA